MIDLRVIVVVSVAYLGLLFAIAYYGDRRADRHRSIIANGYVYALSLGVYATSWTYYGSVGRAASTGVGFLPIYLGATIMAALWWLVLRKIIRICKQNRITSLADFAAARYGKSALLGGLVTVVAVVGIVPYIALQLKAISNSFTVLRGEPPAVAGAADPPLLTDTALYVALLLAAFTIVFGTRKIDAAERHEGMVAAVAFESLVKLIAFLAVGFYVCYAMFDGLGDLFGIARADPDLSQLLVLGGFEEYRSWFWLTVLSMLAVLLLPRQWQVAVVENVDERHIRTATWVFPLYLLLINVFVLPIAIAGLTSFAPGTVNPDAFVLALPLAQQRADLTLLVFVGGLSAATGMVVVETIALATMVSNSLLLPVLLRRENALAEHRDLGRSILRIRRITIVGLLLLGYAYFRMAGESLELVAIGLISFAAVSQFAPAILGGLYWRGATRRGAIWGLVAGFVVWAYTLPLPSLARAGLLPASFVDGGPFGIEMLAPYALFGVTGLDEVTHSMMWSMLVNLGLFVGLSLTGRQDPAEHVTASIFIDGMGKLDSSTEARLWRGSATVCQLEVLLARFLGPDGAHSALLAHAERTGADVSPDAAAEAGLVAHVEALLSGAVGSASARFVVASVVDEEPLAVDEVLQILDETSQVLAYSRALETKSLQLQAATTELRAANERLQELDRLKDEFVSTVSHELRTPLTSIRAFSEILSDNPDLEVAERSEYLQIIVAETERLTRLINQVLDLSKLESGGAEWRVEDVDLDDVVATSVQASAQLFRERQVSLEVVADPLRPAPFVRADRDRLVQVLLNLLSNAVKFCPPETGHVEVTSHPDGDWIQVDVRDNGPGVAESDRAVIFDKFRQGGDTRVARPSGTGLGLPISREIVEYLGGRLWVESIPGEGAVFSFTLPIAEGAH
ncbi:MAG TPA: sensor histidine kinase [Aldersonia sp.]